MRRFHAILMTLGFALLIFLIWKTGPSDLCRQFAFLGWGIIPVMLGEGIAEMIHTIGWRYCLSGSHRNLPWAALFKIRMVGYAINYVTPTAALGGEVIKGALLSSQARGPEAATGVLIGKLCFALGHLVFVVLGGVLIFPRLHLEGRLWRAMFIGGVVVAAGMLMFLLLQQRGKLGAVVRWLSARKGAGSSLRTAASELSAVDQTMVRFYKEQPRDFLLAIGWHVAGYSVSIIQIWLFFHLLHQNCTWTFAAAAAFLFMWFDLLTFAVPLNLGTLEGGRILALQAIGYTSLMGITYGLGLRLAQLFWVCFGLVIYFLRTSQSATFAARRPRAYAVIPRLNTGDGLASGVTIQASARKTFISP